MKLALYLSLTIVGCSLAGQASAHHKKEDLLLLLDGRKNTYDCEIPATDRGTTTASCADHDVIDLRTRKVIGVAVNTAADVDQVGDGFVATGTTFFRLKNGTFTLRGRGTIQPVLEGKVFNNAPVTHFAEIFPDLDEPQVLGGTGKYKDASGTFALLGALDLSKLQQREEQFHLVYFIKFNLRSKK
jgi:hypothetical protein